MLHTCESYRERRKTCEPFTALIVVITEKFVGNDESRGSTHTHTHSNIWTCAQTQIMTVSKKHKSYITREELLGGGTELYLLVDFKGEVRLLSIPPAGAQTCLQWYTLHVLWQLQDLQDINEIGCKKKQCDEKISRFDLRQSWCIKSSHHHQTRSSFKFILHRCLWGNWSVTCCTLREKLSAALVDHGSSHQGDSD